MVHSWIDGWIDTFYIVPFKPYFQSVFKQDLRHSFASKLVRKGGTLKAVQELLGHKDMKMTMRYAHLADDFKKDVVKLLDGDTRNEVSQRKNSKG